MKKLMISSFMALCFLLIIISPAFAGDIITFQLIKKTDYSRQDFGSGTYTAYTMIWAGDVMYLGSKIGEYTASITRTTYAGSNGNITNYDIITPPQAGSIGEFISVRTTHITTGSGSDKGTVYAASPAFKSLMGKSVVMSGDTMTIQD